MRELTKTDIRTVTGGSLLFGWVPNNLNGVGGSFNFDGIFGPGAVALPSFSATPVLSSAGPVTLYGPSPSSQWDC